MARITKESRIQELQEANAVLETQIDSMIIEGNRLRNKLEIIKRLHMAITEEFKE